MISATDISGLDERGGERLVDYLPLDLHTVHNAGVDVLGGSAPLTGRRTLRGIPFDIGADPQRCFIAVDASSNGPITIPIGQQVRRIIFAHRLFDPRPTDLTAADGEMGGVVARWRVRRSDGRADVIPLREHFEVANIPSRRKLFLATDDGPISLAPRHAGRWLDHFAHQQEVHVAGSRDYYLWDWVDPDPSSAIEELILEPAGRRYLLAALTLSFVDEEPFPRCEARAVRFVLVDTERSHDIGALEVEVDRGAATYPYPLPERLDDFNPPGWGEPAIRQAVRSYAKIQAAPSATVRLRAGEDEIASFRWSDLEANGRIASERATAELIEAGRVWARVRVVDADTARPIPCRVHVQSPEGVPYPPHGHHEQVNGYLFRLVGVDVGGDVRLGRTTHAYVPGTFEGWLPRGQAVIDVARGFEYVPVRARIATPDPGGEVTIPLRRMTDMNARGWYSGDTHVHFQSVQESHLEAQAEDLDVVNLLATQLGHTYVNNEDFTGTPSVAPNGESIVFVSSENRSRDHLCILGARRQILPWCTGGPNVAELGGTVDETPAGWADAAHEAGGIVVLAHYSTYAQHEALSLVVTGRADALEFYNQGPAGQAEYYDLLNAGYPVPLVGGTDKMSNELPVGLYRTYAKIAGPFSFESWLAAIRSGRTFMTSGPLISLTVDGHELGDTVHIGPQGRDVVVEARVDSIFPVNSLQIVVGGAVAGEATSTVGATHLDWRGSLRVDADTWIAARSGGPGYATNALRHHIEPPPPGEKPIDFSKAIIAHTSPIYVATGDRWNAFDARVVRYLLTAMEGGIAHLRLRAAIARDVSYAHEDHQAYLERPYQEATAALLRRLESAGAN
jgi:hypothetical protein